MNTSTLLVLDRDWSSYSKGQHFVLVEEVPCGEVQKADGSSFTPVNLRVMFENEAIPQDHHQCRTIPSEYAVEMPRVNAAVSFEANQATRDGNVIAVHGTEYLVEYEMPRGKTFGRIFDVLRPGWHRSVCLTNLPRKWKEELAA